MSLRSLLRDLLITLPNEYALYTIPFLTLYYTLKDKDCQKSFNIFPFRYTTYSVVIIKDTICGVLVIKPASSTT